MSDLSKKFIFDYLMINVLNLGKEVWIINEVDSILITLLIDQKNKRILLNLDFVISS